MPGFSAQAGVILHTRQTEGERPQGQQQKYVTFRRGGVMISIKYLLNNLRKVTFNLFKKVKVEKLSEISIFTHL